MNSMKWLPLVVFYSENGEYRAEGSVDSKLHHLADCFVSQKVFLFFLQLR